VAITLFNDLTIFFKAWNTQRTITPSAVLQRVFCKKCSHLWFLGKLKAIENPHRFKCDRVTHNPNELWYKEFRAYGISNNGDIFCYKRKQHSNIEGCEWFPSEAACYQSALKNELIESVRCGDDHKSKFDCSGYDDCVQEDRSNDHWCLLAMRAFLKGL